MNWPTERIVVLFILIFLGNIERIVARENLPDDIYYLYPLPGSTMLPRKATVFFKSDIPFSSEVDKNALFEVTGDVSGEYEGSVYVSDDNHTVIFIPSQPFKTGEIVRVSLNSAYYGITNFQFEFTVTNNIDKKHFTFHDEEDNSDKTNIPTFGKLTTINGVTVPSDFPRLIPLVEGETAPGKLFLSDRHNYIMILENDGTPYYYLKSKDFLVDFKVLNDELLARTVDENYSYTGEAEKHFYVTMNHQFENLDTFKCGHGYQTDHHDFQYLPNGHTLLIARDKQVVDMRNIVEDGKSQAEAIGTHLQELDRNKQVVFEFRCWDHFDIIDAEYIPINSEYFDWVHMNSMSVDYDGHYLISSRNLSECTKINSRTGDIIWRFGGVNNQFTYINDDDGISFIHMFRPVEGKPGYYTLFDNGNYHTPAYSRAVEFKLDVENMTADKVWEFRHDPDIYAGWLGSVQRLENGNTLINWALPNQPSATEVDPGGNIVYEAKFTSPATVYRTYRFDFYGVAQKPYLILEEERDTVYLIFNKFGDRFVEYFNIYRSINGGTFDFYDNTPLTYYPFVKKESGITYRFKVTAVNSKGMESQSSNIEGFLSRVYQPGDNQVINGDFSLGNSYWKFDTYYDSEAGLRVTTDTSLLLDITYPGELAWHIQLKQDSIELFEGHKYRFEFDAWASAPRTINAQIEKSSSPFTNYGKINPTYITQQRKTYSYDFTMDDETDNNARVTFNCGASDHNVYLDRVTVRELVEEIPVNIAPQYKEINDQNMLVHFGFTPNPATDNTILSFELAQTAGLRLEIIDITGKLAYKQLFNHYSKGNYSIQIHTSDFKTGIYFCKLTILPEGNRPWTKYSKKLIVAPH